jgi:uncharacterized protein YjbJ (UPF0337 family)
MATLLSVSKEGFMGHKMEKMGGKMKKNMGKMTGNRKMEMKGAIKENTAKIKDKFD